MPEAPVTTRVFQDRLNALMDQARLDGPHRTQFQHTVDSLNVVRVLLLSYGLSKRRMKQIDHALDVAGQAALAPAMQAAAIDRDITAMLQEPDVGEPLPPTPHA